MTRSSMYMLVACLQAIALPGSGQQLIKATPNPPSATAGLTTLNQQTYIVFADEETALMTKRLSLNKQQQIKIADLNHTYYQTAAVILQDRQNPSTRKARIDQLRDNRDNTLRTILLPGQYLLFQKAMAESKARSAAKTKMLNEVEFTKRRPISTNRETAH